MARFYAQGYHKAEMKVAARRSSHLEALGRNIHFQLILVGEIQYLAAVGLEVLFAC